MCNDVGMEPLGDIVARLVGELVARPAMPAQEPARSTALLGYQRVSTLTRHSAEAELNWGAPASGEESDASAALAGTKGGDAGRADSHARGSATVLRFTPRKGPAARAAGQFIREDSQTMTAARGNVPAITAGTAGLGNARRRAKL